MKALLNKLFYASIPLIVIAIGLSLSFTQMHLAGGVDKLYHFFGFLFSSLAISFSFYKLFSARSWFFVYLFACCFLGGIAGAVIELMQEHFSTSRISEPEDWLANIAGIGVAVFIVYLVKLRVDKEQEIDGF